MKNQSVLVISDADFKRAVGVQRDIFDIMLEEVKKNIRDFGRLPKLSRTDQVLLTLMCWREYRTEFHTGISYGISESAVCRAIKKIEEALIKSEAFHLPGGGAVCCRSDLKSVLIDASEQPVGRPKKKSRENYSGKKKCFSQKVQIIADFETGEILSSDFCGGRTHDFKLFKESGAVLPPHVLLAAAGCSGNCKNSQKQRNSVQKEKELSFERRGKEG